MSRIIAGTLRGRSLTVPKSGTRPTSDRVREAVFSALESRGALQGAAVLDLYAGSGALGFESLSRGAALLTSVEAAKSAIEVIKANAGALGVRVTAVHAKTATFLERGAAAAPGAPYDLVFVDAPYDVAIDPDLAALAAPGWLADDAVVVIERATKSGRPAFPVSFGDVLEKKYGDTTIWIAEPVPAPAAGATRL